MVASRRIEDMSREEKAARYMAYRIKMLPEQLERARLRVLHLEREAERLGLLDLLEGTKQ